jgi:hypothetical protein
MAVLLMSSAGILAVFSFSISYHIKVTNMFRSNGIPVFRCGYVYDSM